MIWMGVYDGDFKSWHDLIHEVALITLKMYGFTWPYTLLN